ncbi:MAG: TRAP transporter small permease [Desulfotomaculaceae bacterium]|nr:TRAP transporter small permease [Desulfotomaculaceae bacterium]
MNKFTGLVTELSRVLDKIAGLCLVAVMALIVANILLRAIFKSPILGTIDYVTFLTAVMIGLSLAYCAVQSGHIAVDFFVERLPLKIQAVIDMVMGLLTLTFWGLCVWQTAVYANRMAVTGVVSPTTQTPVYPFIYLVDVGLLALCLVLLVRTGESCRKAFSSSAVSFGTSKVRVIETNRRRLVN